MKEINLANFIAPSFDEVFYDVLDHKHTFYFLAGGRGSTKSSFISLMLPLLLLQNSNCHAVALRKVGKDIKNSVYPQIRWALDLLGIADRFRFKVSPFEITYQPTGQKIFFLGVDDPQKIKSIKPPFGYIGIVWYEELDQFGGMEEIRNLNQSFLRGGDTYWEFCSYNPPKSKNNWVNEEILIEERDRLVHRSDYRGVPEEWLGKEFILQAEKLKARNEMLYRHEYLGEVTGTGGAVFDNVEEIELTDGDIEAMEHHYYGLDFGFAVDPLAFVALSYDRKRETLVIYDEIYGQKISNDTAVKRISPIVDNAIITADSSEARTIAEMHALGLNITGAKKGKDSVEHGMKWLEGREKISIDKKRCPNTYREFISYEYERNREGKFISAYPDKDNHSIDAVRYALSRVIASDRIVARRVDY